MRVTQTKLYDLIQNLNNRPEFFSDDPIEDPEDHTWFFAKQKDKVVGWAGVTIKPDGRASIYRTGVLPEFQGQGIKQRLVAAMEKYAKSQGCGIMTSYCLTENAASANSLISSGYKIYWPDMVFAQGKWIYWRKILK